MDPLTQGLVAATAAQLVSTRKQKIAAALMGFLSGMAADLDVLLRSSKDPLLFLEYHRHFTHALIFIPFGALLCAMVFKAVAGLWFKRGQLSFTQTYIICFAGYATHAVLDACTTYGTQLLWPFSDARVAWNNVSVIDPVFTLPLLVLTLYAAFRRSRFTAFLAAGYAFSYLGLGVLQNHRAEGAARELALSRGHTPIELGVKPSIGNLVVWKSVYEYRGLYYVDAIRVVTDSKVYPGTTAEKLDLAKHLSWLDANSQQAKDVERFRWFSNQHLGVDPDNKNRIIDVRYSSLPNEITGMWGIELDETASDKQYVTWTVNRPKGEQMTQKMESLWAMILGR